MSPQSRGADASPAASVPALPTSLTPAAPATLDKSQKSSEKVAGLGILSVGPAELRARLYTIDSLNISPVERDAVAGTFPEIADTFAYTRAELFDDFDQGVSTHEVHGIYDVDLKSAAEVRGSGGATPPAANWEQASWQFSLILQSISPKDRDDLPVLLGKCNRLVPLLAAHPTLQKEVAIEHVAAKVQFMLYDTRSQVRAAAFRVLRHACVSADALQHLVRSKILIFLILAFLTPALLLEKEQALKLVRAFVSIPSAIHYLSVGVVKALVVFVETGPAAPGASAGAVSGGAGAELDSDQNLDKNMNSDRKFDHVVATPEEFQAFSRMCIETIGEIAVVHPEIVFLSGGLRLLINMTVNGTVDVSVACFHTLITLLDMPHARFYLRSGADLHGLMAVFTLFEDDDQPRAPHSKKYHAKALQISFMLLCTLKSWPGLVCFCHDSCEPIKMLLLNLRKRNVRLRNIILDLLLDILRIRILPWLEDSTMGDLLTQVHRQFTESYSPDSKSTTDKKGKESKKNCAEDASPSFTYAAIDPKSFEHGVIAHFRGLLAKILINCGIVPLLFTIVDENRNEENTTKATLLLTNLLDLCARNLPPEFYRENIMKAYHSSLSLTTLSKIEAATQLRQPIQNAKHTADVRHVMRDLSQKLRVEVSDLAFKTLISATRVLTVKEFEEWNWAQLSLLFQGPIRSVARFNELQEKYPKFLKTFMSFLRPFKYRFSSTPITASSKFPKIRKPKNVMLVACQLVEGLLATEEGSAFLSSNKIMPQIAEIFAQIDPFSGIDSKEPILAKRRLEHSLSIGYVKMVGIMSSSPRGLEILAHWQLFQMISNIIDSSTGSEANNYLIFNILLDLDYTHKGHSRIILAKAMSISNWKVKMYALQSIFPVIYSLQGCENLYVLSLVNLLYDASDAVTKMSIECLFDYFVSKDNLGLIDTLVDCRPSIKILEQSKEGQFLLLSFCKTSSGFKYLEENGYIEKHFVESLASLHGLDYLTVVEDSLRRQLFPYAPYAPHSKSSGASTLHHFFHYLLATEEGFNYFNSRREFIDEAVSSITLLCRILNIVDGLDEADNYIDGNPHANLTHMQARNESFASGDSPVEMSVTPRDFRHWPPSATWAKSAESIFDDASSASRPMLSPREAFVQDEEYLLKRLKQYMWVIGEIASANFGMQILEPMYSSTPSSTHIAETILLIFEKANHWQLRGLAFFQLGKMAATVEGIEILDDLQWTVFDSPQSGDTPLAYPKSMQHEGFTKVEIVNPYKDVSYYSLFGHDQEISVTGDLDLEDEVVIESYEEMDEKILSLFNHVSSVLGRIERKAVRELNRIKANSPQVFENTSLFLKTIRLVDKGKFKYRARTFIFELFNTMKIMEGLTKKERKYSSARRQVT